MISDLSNIRIHHERRFRKAMALPAFALVLGYAHIIQAEQGSFVQPALATLAAEHQNNAPRSGLALLQQLNEALISIYEAAAPSVVVIKVLAEERERSSPWPGEASTPPLEELPDSIENQGAGFLVTPDGYIYTNAHVIHGAESIRVVLKDGRRFEAKVIGADEQTDVAVIKIDGQGLPVARLANSDEVRVGQLACAIGHPFDQEFSFTLGCISGVARSNLKMVNYEEYLQTDASINPGNSGGPIVDIEGRVIGMATLINGINRGLGFAIPINTVNDIGRELILRGRVIRPYLGISMQSLSRVSDSTTRFPNVNAGLVILTIHQNSPAFRSDLRADDVILSIDGVAVSTERELQKRVLTKKIGQAVTLRIWRAGKTMDVNVVTAELPQVEEVKSNDVPLESLSGEEIGSAGFRGTALTAEAARLMRIAESGGVLVTFVEEDSTAAMAGIATGDVIVAINDTTVKTPADIRSELEKHDLQRGAVVYLYRDGKKSFVMLRTPP